MRIFYGFLTKSLNRFEVKGLPNTKLEFFLQDFKKYVKHLMSYEDIYITHLHIEEAHEDNDFQFLTLRELF